MNTTVDIVSDLADLEQQDWLDAVDDIAEELGYFEPLGPDHSAVFIDAGPKLLVTFETIQHVRRGNKDEEPLGWRFAREHGWSSLTILSDGETFFRHRAIYGYFDRLVDDGFFEDFDQVLFTGTYTGGYGAAAYSVTAPGANVLALRPVATLDPAIARWDRRTMDKRRLNFSDRYGYAPDMVDAANQAWVITDPDEVIDSVHASLFTRSNVTQLTCPRVGWKLDRELAAMRILDDVIVEAMEGSLTRQSFAQAYRARQVRPAYLRATLNKIEESGNMQRAAWFCRAVLARQSRPLFIRKLDEYIQNGIVSPDFAASLQEPAE